LFGNRETVLGKLICLYVIGRKDIERPEICKYVDQISARLCLLKKLLAYEVTLYGFGDLAFTELIPTDFVMR